MQIKLIALEDTQQIAVKIAKVLQPGTVICLVGDLGAGKTTFTQYLCEALGVTEYVTSPTFNLMNTYTGQLNNAPVEIYHFDVYRIFDEDELIEIGFDEFLFGKGISIVEWANQVPSLLPDQRIWIDLHFNEKGERIMTLQGVSID